MFTPSDLPGMLAKLHSVPHFPPTLKYSSGISGEQQHCGDFLGRPQSIWQVGLKLCVGASSLVKECISVVVKQLEHKQILLLLL